MNLDHILNNGWIPIRKREKEKDKKRTFFLLKIVQSRKKPHTEADMKQCADPKTEALARNDSHPPQRATSHAMNQGWDVGNATVIWALCIYEGAPRSKPKNWISASFVIDRERVGVAGGAPEMRERPSNTLHAPYHKGKGHRCPVSSMARWKYPFAACQLLLR